MRESYVEAFDRSTGMLGGAHPGIAAARPPCRKLKVLKIRVRTQNSRPQRWCITTCRPSPPKMRMPECSLMLRMKMLVKALLHADWLPR